MAPTQMEAMLVRDSDRIFNASFRNFIAVNAGRAKT
jgi:hypothetical protein